MLLIFIITGLILAVAIYTAAELVEESKNEKILWRDHHANTENGLINLGTFFHQNWIERHKAASLLKKIEQGGKQFEVSSSGAIYSRREDGSLKRIDKKKPGKKIRRSEKDCRHKQRFAEQQAELDFKNDKTVEDNPFDHDDLRRTFWTQRFVQLKRSANG